MHVTATHLQAVDSLYLAVLTKNPYADRYVCRCSNHRSQRRPEHLNVIPDPPKKQRRTPDPGERIREPVCQPGKYFPVLRRR